jgi:hypothetical protein
MVILLPYKRNNYFTNLEFGLSFQINAKVFTQVLRNIKVKTVSSAYLVLKSDATIYSMLDFNNYYSFSYSRIYNLTSSSGSSE